MPELLVDPKEKVGVNLIDIEDKEEKTTNLFNPGVGVNSFQSEPETNPSQPDPGAKSSQPESGAFFSNPEPETEKDESNDDPSKSKPGEVVSLAQQFFQVN